MFVDAVTGLLLASVAILVSGGGVQLDMVTLGGARPNVMVVPELVALVANLWLDTLVTIRLVPSGNDMGLLPLEGLCV